MQTQLPLTTEDFYSRLKALGLIPENMWVSSITIHADAHSPTPTLQVEGIPVADVTEVLT